MDPASISQYCVYTIHHLDGLKDACKRAGSTTWSEFKSWSDVQKRRILAETLEQWMPILFSAADTGGGILYFGRLDDVVINRDRPRKPFTEYTFSNLTIVTPPRLLQSLRLVNSGEQLSPKFIRPYAICYTPDFIKDCS
jgi:hypothetical protein